MHNPWLIVNGSVHTAHGLISVNVCDVRGRRRKKAGDRKTEGPGAGGQDHLPGCASCTDTPTLCSDGLHTWFNAVLPLPRNP